MTYVVLDIRSGIEVKRTVSAGTAAQCLTAGTTFGKGPTVADAREQADARRKMHLGFAPYNR
jgi:hypothetical protein